MVKTRKPRGFQSGDEPSFTGPDFLLRHGCQRQLGFLELGIGGPCKGGLLGRWAFCRFFSPSYLEWSSHLKQCVPHGLKRLKPPVMDSNTYCNSLVQTYHTCIRLASHLDRACIIPAPCFLRRYKGRLVKDREFSRWRASIQSSIPAWNPNCIPLCSPPPVISQKNSNVSNDITKFR